MSRTHHIEHIKLASTKCKRFSVRISRPWKEPIFYETSAESTFDAINEAMTLHGIEVRISAKQVMQ